MKKLTSLLLAFMLVVTSGIVGSAGTFSYATGEEGGGQNPDQGTDQGALATVTVTANVAWEGVSDGEELPDAYLGLFRETAGGTPEMVEFDDESGETNPKQIDKENRQSSITWDVVEAEGDPEYTYSVKVVDAESNITDPEFFNSVVTLEDNTHKVTLTKKTEYERFLSKIEIQTPEAGDDYVSVFVDMPSNLPNLGLNKVTDEYVKDNLSVTVIIDGQEYATAYAIDDTTGKPNGYKFFYTIDPKEKKCPKLSEGKEISFRYELGGTDRTDVTTVGAAFVNKEYAAKPLKNIVVTPKTKTYTYNGKYNKPAVSVTAKYSDGKAVPAAALSYVLSYEKAKNVGTATVKVTMVGDYTGTGKATYKINPKGVAVKKIKALKKGFNVTWNPQKTKMNSFYITGYQVQYATNKKFTQNAKTLTVGTKENKSYKTTSKKVTKLKAKKKYFVRVRTYKKLYGVKYYSPWSAAKTVTTKK
ncbi:MAG: fibronectin type III domain-containing protein [Mogibacterium sp.]|nr:fibronectin type III domain-containing protein [Mogibacterium sp.]